MVHKDLDYWKRSLSLSVSIYKVTSKYPVSERFGLSQQMRRAAVSVLSNIAEGAARKNTTELVHFLYISLGSLSELETQLILSVKLDFYSDKSLNLLGEITEIRRMIQSSIRKLKEK